MPQAYNFNVDLTHLEKPVSLRTVLKMLRIPRKWQHFLRIEKQVTVNGRYVPFNTLIYADDQVCLYFDQVTSNQQIYLKSGQPLKIVFEDENVLIINKPTGQKTHPNAPIENDTAINDVMTYLATQKAQAYIVHRLDMLTSGLLLFAKNPVVVPVLNRQLATKTMQRFYYAIVETKKLHNNSGTIEGPIAPDPNDPRKRIISPTGLKATTHYQILQHNARYALLKIALETGRTHQIRVHLASVGMPILGDPLYNPDYHAGDQLRLFAYQLDFIRPFSLTPLHVRLDLPSTFQQLVN